MRFRRALARSRLLPHELPLTLTSFPRLGVPGVFTDPYFPPGRDVARSWFLPDEVINQHVRFPTLTANIRRRRTEKVAMNMPVFFDEKTPRPFIDPTIPERREWPEDENAANGAALPDHIYLDAMGFGMGCCCLQITFQACSIGESRKMYDAFVPVGPVMLALSAASPIFRGLLADVDCRWDVIAGSVDDRTAEERALKPLKDDRFVIPKSRYDSVDCYMSDSPFNRPEYNDNAMPIDESIRDRLVREGMDDKLATHFAHLFIRDPIVIFEETMCQDDEKSSDHFEVRPGFSTFFLLPILNEGEADRGVSGGAQNIQSTNWQTVRFKPPPPGSPIGWRVEFRSMEVQLTDYENAAFAVFIVLLTRAIMTLGLNFYMPISKVDENMHRAHRRDAVNTQKFFFRKDLFSPKPGHACDPPMDAPVLPTASAFSPSSDSPSTAPTPSTVNASAPTAPPASPHPKINGILHSRDPSSASSISAASASFPTSPSCSSHAPSRATSPAPAPEFEPVEDEYAEFSIDEIFNWTKDGAFPGLIGVVRRYLDGLQQEGKVSESVRKGVERSLDLVSRRADGSLITTASWIRNFVRSHPSYQHDSVVSPEINYDLIRTIDAIERGELSAPELLPEGWRDGYKEGERAWRACCGDRLADELEKDGEHEAVKAGAAVVEDKGVCVGPMQPAAQ
ncbi:glutamate--cysteine ligase [Rhodosporidiobolus nylandii]